MATGYTKKLVLETDKGQVTFDGAKARAVQNRLDNDARFIHFTKPEHDDVEEYYNINTYNGKATLAATVTSGTAVIADVECEDPLNACAPEIIELAPREAGQAGSTSITLTGRNFGQQAIVFVDGKVVSGAKVKGNTITFTAPAHKPGAVKVTVLDNGKESEAYELTYTE